MKNLIKNTFVLAALCAAAFPAQAQTMLTPTTLSAAVTSGSTRLMVVASATNCIVGNVLYTDRELADITAVSGTTLTVRRGAAGTVGTPHISGAYVFCGPPGAFTPSSSVLVNPDGNPSGSCTRNAQLYLPVINPKTGIISECLGGAWVGSDTNNGGNTTPRATLPFPETGGTAYTAINTNGTTLSATTLYCSEVFLSTTKLLTGIALLNGTTVGTDNHYVILYDSTGKALANSALAGALAASASTYQTFAFTAKYLAVGPAQYFACFQTNGTTATVRMVVTGTQDTLLTKGQTAATFGTVPALTVPTTFTTAVGPYVYLY